MSKLKKDEAEALSNKEKMKEMVIEDNLQEDNSKPKSKEGDKTKKKLLKMNTQKEKTDILIKEFKTQISKISKSLGFTTTEVICLGVDRNLREYFFFIREPHRIYINYREFVLSSNTKWMIYEGKEKILELLNSFINKGVHEKRLTENINHLIKETIFHDLTPEDNFQEYQPH